MILWRLVDADLTRTVPAEDTTLRPVPSYRFKTQIFISHFFLYKSNLKLIILRFLFCRYNFNIDHLSLFLFILLISEIFKSSEFSYKSGKLQYIVHVQNLGNIVRVFWN